MKCERWFRITIVILIHAFAQAQSSAEGSTNTRRIPTGVVENNQYTNEFLEFSYPLPDGWLVNNALLQKDQAARQASRPALVLLVLDQHVGRTFKNRIVMGAAEPENPALTPLEAISSLMDRAKDQQADYELLRDFHPVDFARQQFFREDFKQSWSGLVLYKANLVTKFRGYFLFWSFVAGSPKELEEAVSSLTRISFLHHPVVNVSSKVSHPILLKKVRPEYPERARRAKLQGQIVLKALIDTNGEVIELDLVSGHPLLVPAAATAVKQWRYKPYLVNGRPTEVETEITVSFALGGRR